MFYIILDVLTNFYMHFVRLYWRIVSLATVAMPIYHQLFSTLASSCMSMATICCYKGLQIWEKSVYHCTEMHDSWSNLLLKVYLSMMDLKFLA